MIDTEQIRHRLETWKAMTERAEEMHNRIRSNDREGEHACFHCETKRELRQCNTCNGQAYIIDCGHYEQPAYISWCDEENELICDDCHFDKEEDEENEGRCVDTYYDGRCFNILCEHRWSETCFANHRIGWKCDCGSTIWHKSEYDNTEEEVNND